MFLNKFLRKCLCEIRIFHLSSFCSSPDISKFSFSIAFFSRRIFLFFSQRFFSCCPPLLSSSFQLFICLLLGCLFRLSNDKCILRANIGKNKMWFELDGTLLLLLLLLLSHIMLESLGISILFFFFAFFSFPLSPSRSHTHSLTPSLPSSFTLRCSPFFSL